MSRPVPCSDKPFGRAARAGLMLVALTTAALFVPGPARAADSDTLEKQVEDSLRPFYADALTQSGSTLKPDSPGWNASLARTASAFLAARPDDCSLNDWLAARCAVRSLITPSQAMAPSLMAGDTFLAIPPDDAHPLQRGDVVAFRDPHAKDPGTATIYVSRLIGLPGETIALHEGIVEIDGKATERETTGNTVEIDGEELGRFTERLPNGRSHDILRPAKLPTDSTFFALQENMPAVVVPPGHYFMLGDNRLNSMDSRFASTGEGPGLPATGHVVGRAGLIYVSRDPSRIGTHP